MKLCSRVAALFFSAVASVEGACPDLEVQKDFNVTEFIRATWYVQKQQLNGYQRESSLNCVAATYNETFHGKPLSVPFFGGKVLTVFNDCRLNDKDGPVCNNFTSPDFKPSFAIPLCARLYNEEEPAKLGVAPCLLPNILSGNYWVAAAGPRPDNYEYAVVIAGQPSVEKSDGCTTPDTCSNPAQFSCGLWLFHREATPGPEGLATLERAAHEKGISTQLLRTVDHNGCNYEGYEIKPNVREAPLSPGLQKTDHSDVVV
eukprot:TRINITY_DN7190_c0_g3_i1.p1 TRINITY_DN7190_c0_g3~~TRINITY_DN7190_c0_g3_i1.p1  ORF type:complete len:296 (-),score=47.31 TRINITY_DN7190_c0_g3_i1:89-865(-)